MTAIHNAAAQGFAAQADTYARGRPEYPAELAHWLHDTLGLAPGKSVVDLGAGTGKFTRLLAATGASVVAVEPVAEMRAQLAAKLPDATVLAGTAEAIPLPDASVHAVVCAQAFHWFASPAVLAEIHRVLAPGGALALIWNVRDESLDWVAALTEIMQVHEGDAPRFRSGAWRQAFAGDASFSELQETRFAHRHVGTPETVIVDRCMSVSFIAALPVNEKAGVERQLRTLIATHPALRGRESIALPYQTLAYHCHAR
jgi:SAM-dependent methyltransferase